MKVVNIESFDNIPGVEYVKLSGLREFLLTAPNEPTVVVVPPVDYGLCYQHEHSIANDMKKDFALNFEHYAQEIGEGTGLEPIYFTPRANVGFCKLTDECSVKIDTWTHCTLDLDIPTNIHIFMSNCNIDHPRITKIPFGVNSPDEDNMFDMDVMPTLPAKQDRLYLNFSEHTFERKILNMHFGEIDWATVVTKLDPNGPNAYDHRTYLNQIASHKYVLCPTGVGCDSYRVWETLFVGSIPVMKRDYWNEWMELWYPVILVDDFYDITDVAYLKDCGESDTETYGLLDWDKKYISEEYWRGIIEDAVRQ